MEIKLEFPEGATPLNDCSGLIVKWVRSQKDLDRVEAENIATAQKLYLKSSVPDPRKWFTVSFLKKIHQAMFGSVWEWAGGYRKEVTSIGIKPYLIPSQLAAFCGEVVSWSDEPVELSILERSAMIHHRLVCIHPFENGNGRFSRLVADRYLLAWKLPHPYWPIDLQSNGKHRSTYIEALREADRGNIKDLVELMKDLGAREPTSVEIAKSSPYKSLSETQRESLERALKRR